MVPSEQPSVHIPYGRLVPHDGHGEPLTVHILYSTEVDSIASARAATPMSSSWFWSSSIVVMLWVSLSPIARDSAPAPERRHPCCCVCQLVKSKIAGSCHATTSCYNTYFQMSENMATQMSFAGKLNDAITLCVEDEKPTPSTICCIGKYRSRSDLCLAMGAIPTVAED